MQQNMERIVGRLADRLLVPLVPQGPKALTTGPKPQGVGEERRAPLDMGWRLEFGAT